MQEANPNFLDFLATMPRMRKKSPSQQSKPNQSALNPTYLKIGKRIRQARQMAKETNSRELSLRLGWSAGRINNFEVGISTPGPDETEILCRALRAEPAWITYGVGSPRAEDFNVVRHRNLMAAIGEAEASGELPALLEALANEESEQIRQESRCSGQGPYCRRARLCLAVG